MNVQAGKRTLVVRLSPDTVIAGYVVSVPVAYLSMVGGVVLGLVPAWDLIALLIIPLAVQAAGGLARHYDRPYEIMSYLQANVLLHLSTGVLLIAGTVVGMMARA